MRVALCGRNLADLEIVLRKFPLQIVATDPTLVISYGGDGALLGAEREFPGVTKCPVRDSSSGPQCAQHGAERILSMLSQDELSRSSLVKLHAVIGGETVAGINDVQINKANPSSAVRFRLRLGDELYRNQIVGDGLVVATPFGSTGYYRSITHSSFRVGTGLAFNNSTEPLDHLVIDARTPVDVEIIRGPALLFADNDPKRIALDTGDRVTVTKGAEETVVLGLEIFRCPACLQLRHDAV